MKGERRGRKGDGKEGEKCMEREFVSWPGLEVDASVKQYSEVGHGHY